MNRTRYGIWILLILCASASLPEARSADWKPAKAPLDTPWTAKVDPFNPLPEHPRPDFQRNAWKSLNGLWDYALEKVDFQPMQGFIDKPSLTTGVGPAEFAGKILVPFAIDSPLSGIMHVLRPQERLWYQREFTVPDDWKGRRVLLHFEASDWETGVYVNSRRVGQHRGGYDPFHFDITDALKSGANALRVCVWDGTEQHCQPLGKQIMPENRKGFRYQPTGGIWQTVWLEAVPRTRIVGWKVTPRLDGFDYAAELSDDADDLRLRISVDGAERVANAVGGEVKGSVTIRNPKLWSPDSPHLYDVKLELLQNGGALDTVKSYVGLRTIAREKEGRFLLNGKPAPFQFGPLDQGYWPDGILTPPHEDAVRFDLEYLKSIGCNMVRVHIKTHPQRWYYHADRLGLLVWQDMICTPKYGQTVDAAGSANWRREFAEIISDFHNHPSIVQWVVFNEAWGQHDTVKHTEWAAREDPSRLILSASGWNDHGAGDTLDVHNYRFYPSAPVADGFGSDRALVFGELGGHNLLLPGKKWHPDQENQRTVSLERAGGRMDFASIADLAVKYPFYLRNLRHFISRQGYQGFVYTQITDVEHECNGWLTYDRRVSKLPAEAFHKLHEALSAPLTYEELVGSGEWKQAEVGAVGRKLAEASPAWTKGLGGMRDPANITLPYAGGPLAKAPGRGRALGLRREYSLKGRPGRAVIEIRAQHTDALGEPPEPRLDGHHPRAAVNVPFISYLDGQLHRRGVVGLERGQGEGVTFLELTDAELATLTPGRHSLSIELPQPDAVIAFDAKLLSYAGRPMPDMTPYAAR